MAGIVIARGMGNSVLHAYGLYRIGSDWFHEQGKLICLGLGGTAAGRGKVVGLCSVNIEGDILPIIGGRVQGPKDMVESRE